MKFEIYKDKKGEWRWRLKSKNGKIVATGGEGYKKKTTMVKTITRIVQCLGSMAVLQMEEVKK